MYLNSSNSAQDSSANQNNNSNNNENNNQHSVDTDFDSYWEEEARNPHRNRIRIGRQYQATVPPLCLNNRNQTTTTDNKLDDQRNLEHLETLSFCPKKSAKVSDSELDHYFTVAKSLNLFASLVETRSLLGRDVTIADLNHIRRKEGLSLASVIQPPGRQTANYCNPNVANSAPNLLTAQSLNTTTASGSGSSNSQQQSSPQKSPPTTSCDPKSAAAAAASSSSSGSSASSPKDSTVASNLLLESQFQTFNQPLMKALSHFISLHHPCHHDRECKKLLKETPLEVESAGPVVSITAGNLRQGSSSFSSKSETKAGRSRSSLKQAATNAAAAAASTSSSAALQGTKDETQAVNLTDKTDNQEQQAGGSSNTGSVDSVQSPPYDDWTREEVELFSKAIEVCGKNFSSIKKEFLPSKSVRSIVEYYYIGSRDVSENKKKTNPPVDTSDACSSPEKSIANNNGGQGGGGSSSNSGKSGPNSNVTGASNSTSNSSSRTTATASSTPTTNTRNDPNNPNKTSTTDSSGATKQKNDDQHHSHAKTVSSSKNLKSCNNNQNLNGSNVKAAAATTTTTASIKNIDPRMSVYNFDEEFKEDSPIRFDCPRPGAEVKPLKAKPIIPNSSIDSDAANSNVGSLKFFMDGQLVLKLNACQEQQEGIEKCHWVQSGDKMINASRQKRYTKRADKTSAEFNQNGSQSNSVVSSFQDDDSKNDDLTGDEDSKESMNSFSSNNLPQQKTNYGSPASKRLKVKPEQQPNSLQQQGQLPSPINYNRLAIDNRMKERNDNLNQSSPMINQAAAAMPWLQANSFAMAAALLGGLPFPPAAGTLIDHHAPQSNVNSVNMASKPMDLTLEHSAPKSIQKSSSRSKSRPKNN